MGEAGTVDIVQLPIQRNPIHLSRILLTCDASSESLAVEEVRQTGMAHLPGSWLDTGDAVQGSILLVETDLDFATFSQGIESSRAIFIRHLAPVEDQLELSGDPEDLTTIAALAPELASRIRRHLSFSVQSRILGEGKLPFRKVVLNETLSQSLEQLTGAAMDCRNPQQVVSILCSPERAYVGVSLTAQNRSAWPGGRHRFKRDDDQISRAEFKLLEAESVFDFRFPGLGLALDIGASPGGWSRVLADRGLRVDAVDPADLDRRLRSKRQIRHVRARIQDYSPGQKRFAAIVNDMKMDARDSVELMLRFAPHLEPEGVAVMTLKLPKFSPSPESAVRALAMIQHDLGRLESGYRLVGARQLYHNRSEVTVVLGPPGGSARRASLNVS